MITVNSREDFLMEVKKQLPDKTIAFEIGVSRGDFAEKILSIINPLHLILVDPYETGGIHYGNELAGVSTAYSTEAEYRNLLQRFDREILERKVMVRKNYAHEIVMRYPPESIDFIYHDASHLYEDVKRDLNQWLPKLKPDGIVAGHDYVNFNGFGVIQAVDDFCKEHNFQMIIFNDNGGDFALKRK